MVPRRQKRKWLRRNRRRAAASAGLDLHEADPVAEGIGHFDLEPPVRLPQAGLHVAIVLRGEFLLQVRATNAAGETQPATAPWNPAGYMRNVIETVRVMVA